MSTAMSKHVLICDCVVLEENGKTFCRNDREEDKSSQERYGVDGGVHGLSIVSLFANFYFRENNIFVEVG